ncbi:MAG: hypothetical protein ACKO7B_19690, partial [Flavobacteriales bacterium]
GGLLGLLTRIMNDLMQWSATWPCALIDRIYWQPWEAIACAVLIVCTCLTILGRNKRMLFGSISIGIGWFVVNTVQLGQLREESEVCIHSSFLGESITACNQGLQSIIASNAEKDNRMLNYRLSFESCAIDTLKWNGHASTPNTYVRPPWLQVNDRLLLMADSTLVHQSLDDSSIVVYFTDEGKPRYWKKEELRRVYGHTVILGNKLSRKRRSWLKAQLSDSCKVFDLREGAVLWRAGWWGQFGDEED